MVRKENFLDFISCSMILFSWKCDITVITMQFPLNAFDGSDGHRAATINALHTHKYQTANFEYCIALIDWVYGI